MKGDFTRTTFDAARQFSRVLMQQGRVTLDADVNEQTEILLHYLRTLAADLIGPYAGPAAGAGFGLSADADGRLTIGAGRYYVDGLLVENPANCLYTEQPHRPASGVDPLVEEMEDTTGKTFWIYLDVWERHVTHLDVPAIREVALGGPDTCSRSQVVWQVRARAIGSGGNAPSKKLEAQRAALEREAAEIQAQLSSRGLEPDERKALETKLASVREALRKLDDGQAAPEFGDLDCAAPLDGLVELSPAAMAARIDPGYQRDDPCVLSPQAKYRGVENHLYRVEIHAPGKAGTATFKWSRDNGSVAAAWLGTAGHDLSVSSTRGFTAGCWVELIDEARELLGEPGALVKVAKVEGQTLSVDPASVTSSAALEWSDLLVNPKVRRWDQVQRGDVVLDDGAVPVVESSTGSMEWIDLEDAIQVQFAPGGEYRTGDYWTIPARVATGSIEWPEDAAGEAAALMPFGIEHHYAPLGFVKWEGKTLEFQPCACTFRPRSSCAEAAAEPDADRAAGRKPRPRPGSIQGVARPAPAAPAPKATGSAPKRKKVRKDG